MFPIARDQARAVRLYTKRVANIPVHLKRKKEPLAFNKNKTRKAERNTLDIDYTVERTVTMKAGLSCGNPLLASPLITIVYPVDGIPSVHPVVQSR